MIVIQRRFSDVRIHDTEISPTIEMSGYAMEKVYNIVDSRYRSNLPMIMTFQKSRRAKSKDDFETWIESDITNTLNVFEGGGHKINDLDSD